MNKVILMGRLTRDPEVRYSAGENSMAIARYTIAVDRRFKRDGEATADFIGCVAFGRQAEFAEKYFRQGIKIAISGRIQTGSYVNKDGVKSTPQMLWLRTRSSPRAKQSATAMWDRLADRECRAWECLHRHLVQHPLQTDS